MRLSWLEWAIAGIVLLVIFTTGWAFLPEWYRIQQRGDHLLSEPTLLLMELTISYHHAPARDVRSLHQPVILSETWQITNKSGVTHLRYHARSASMLGILDLPALHTIDSAALYDALALAHVWRIETEPHACLLNTYENCYRLHVRTQQGNEAAHERIVMFDDDMLRQDHRREFWIRLNEHRSSESPFPTMLTLEARNAHNPQYERYVKAFKAFGDQRIQRELAQTRWRVLH